MAESFEIALLEPYFGGSHAVFVDTWRRHSRHKVHVATMPARKWKWRMRGAALWFTRNDTSWMRAASGRAVDAIVCNDMLSVADLRALLPGRMRNVPVACYFHENQLTYPIADEDDRDFQYGMTNISSGLSADAVWFNTAYHRDAFLVAADELLRLMPDCVPPGLTEQIRAKSTVLYPPVEAAACEPVVPVPPDRNAPPRILWSHRWEYDKNPRPFFDALVRLDNEGVDFKLVCVGEQFRTAPPEFATAWEQLQHRLVHAGYVPSRMDYLRTIESCQIVVSTAIQENFGIAVLEAVAAGCQPVVPARLAYPEVIPEAYHAECLYGDDDRLCEHLRGVLTGPLQLGARDQQGLSEAVRRRFGPSATVSALDEAVAVLATMGS